MSLYLVGPRGAGKSVAGRLAASRLQAPFIDSDQEVQRRAGLCVAEIFARLGEVRFRALEREVMLELLARPGILVATGGGCVLDEKVRRGLRRSRGAIWLHAPLSVLQARIDRSARPSLTGRGPAEELEVLVRQREPLYLECSARSLDTGPRSVAEVAHVIEQLWTQLAHRHLR